MRASAPGYCWATSAVEGRRYTWRCGRGRYVHDPCFSAKPRSRLVACPDAPWSKRVLSLRLTRPLPPWKVYGGTWRIHPWGVMTTGGKHCFTLAATATGEVAGRQPTYTCEGDSLLLGFPRRQTPTWTIYHAVSWRSKRANLVAISDAWW